MTKQRIGLLIFYFCFVGSLLAMPIVTLWGIPIMMIGLIVYLLLPHNGYGLKPERKHLKIVLTITVLLAAGLWVTDLMRVILLAQLPIVFMITYFVILWLWDIRRIEQAGDGNEGHARP